MCVCVYVCQVCMLYMRASILINIYYVRAQPKKETNEGWARDLRLWAHGNTRRRVVICIGRVTTAIREPDVECSAAVNARERNKWPNCRRERNAERRRAAPSRRGEVIAAAKSVALHRENK